MILVANGFIIEELNRARYHSMADDGRSSGNPLYLAPWPEPEALRIAGQVHGMQAYNDWDTVSDVP